MFLPIGTIFMLKGDETNILFKRNHDRLFHHYYHICIKFIQSRFQDCHKNLLIALNLIYILLYPPYSILP